MNEDTKRRIIAYYELLAKKESNHQAAETMKKLVERLTDKEALILEKKLADRDSFYTRMMAYKDRLSSIMMAAEDQVPYGIDAKGANTKTMNELNEVHGGYDMDQEICEKINGNTFIYKKTFPINEYRRELEEIGNEETGNDWYVRLDEEGRLVVY